MWLAKVLFSSSGSLKQANRTCLAARRDCHRAERSTRARFVPRLEALEDRTVPSAGYAFSTLNEPGAGTTGSFVEVQGTFALNINNHGQIVGNYGDANYLTHGFLLSHGQYSTFDDPKAGNTANASQFFFPGTDATGLNNRGQIVGFYIDANNVEHSFLLSGGQFTTIDPPGAANLPGPSPLALVNVDQAVSINNRGQIVGGYTDANNVTHGYLLSDGHYTTLDAPGAVSTIALGINDHGQIVGYSIDSSGVTHGFLLSHGQYTSINDPNAGTGAGQGTTAFQINNSGQITGWYVDSSGVGHGFVLSGGQYTTLDDPNAGTGAGQGTFTEGINGRGQVVGYYVDLNDLVHGFVATPVSGNMG
jgi:probable HAF family extracellular repeat protein